MARWLGIAGGLAATTAAIWTSSAPTLPQKVLSYFSRYPDAERLQCRPFLPPSIFLDDPPDAEEPEIQDASRKLRQVIDQLEAADGFETIAVAVTTAHGPIFLDTRGQLRSNETGSASVTPESQYRVASVSKLTPVFIGWLFQQQGIISWDDRVKDYLPRLSESWEETTIYDLATHMSGLGRDWPPGTVRDWPYSADGGGAPPYNGHGFPTVESLLRGIAENKAVTPPWTEPTYSNTGAGLLGLVLQEASRRHHGTAEAPTFPELARREVFGPLSMDGSHFLVAEENAGNVVVPSFMAEVVDQDFTDTMNAAGGQFSSLSDTARFAQFLLHPGRKEGLLKQKTVNRWFKPVVSFEEDDLTELGLMWEIIKHPDAHGRFRHVYQKLGLMFAFGSCISLQPGSSYGIVVHMTGVFPDAGAVCWETLQAFQPAIDSILAKRARKLYVGEWSSADGLAKAITSLHKGTLFLDQLTYNGTNVLETFQMEGRFALRSTARKDEFRIDTGFPGGFNGKPHLGCYAYWNGKDDWGVKNGFPINLISFGGDLDNRSLGLPSLGAALRR
ncbi:hypothetical protein VTK73DRAFT_6164 [Phialemonium thermophilum]|uniref:Beta-lactamase-related domain-containing protein n=1 Tax=Phialemonium thermophilum TaxID=223376 RepID=A0ABR3WL18_9PEZI